MPSPLALYRCTHCWRNMVTVCDIGPKRLMWCGRCASSRTFERRKDRLVAKTWPPPARETQP